MYYKNNFSIKNSKLYKMKFINTRNCEYKLLNNKDINKEVNALIDEYVTMQENAVEKLKQFL